MMSVILISKALRYGTFQGGVTVLSATHTLIHEWYEPSCIYSTAAEHHRTLAGTHFPSAEDRRLSWPQWLVTDRGGTLARRRSPIPVLTGLNVQYFVDTPNVVTATPNRHSRTLQSGFATFKK